MNPLEQKGIWSACLPVQMQAAPDFLSLPLQETHMKTKYTVGCT